MNARNMKAVALEMIFGSKEIYERFNSEVRDDAEIEKNVIRGRVTPSGAWMKLVVRGAAGRIDEIVREWRDWTLATTALPRSVA